MSGQPNEPEVSLIIAEKWLDQRTGGHFHEFRVPRDAMVEMLEAFATARCQPYADALDMQEKYSDAADEEIEELKEINRVINGKRS
jgi:hypothetical protein